MRVLFVSGELIGSAVVHRLLKEGHEIKLYIDHIDRKDCFSGFVERVDNWEQELSWVGKDGLIVFDDVTFKGEQDNLRKQGYRVFGGSAESDQLELDREYFQKVLEEHGLPVLPSHNFTSAHEAIAFVKQNPGAWVVKQNSHIGMLNYVGERSDAKDVLSVLELYKKKNILPIHLQRRVFGVEIGIARYFNGNDWVGPIEVNIEHKPMCNGNIGPLTAEMGTLIWYEEDETLPMYQATLAKLKPYLKKIGYKGDFDINCIVDEKNIWPLEATARLGTPETELHCALHKSSWGELLSAVADGTPYEIDFHRGYGVVVSVAVPPFPFGPEVFGNSNIETSYGTHIFLDDELTAEEREHIHFEEVSVEQDDDGEIRHFLAGKHGYALYVTGCGETVEVARAQAYGILKKIIVPKMFYRTDIGEQFIKEDRQKLIEWGYIKDK